MGAPFTILHSVSHVQDKVHTLEVLLLHIQKDLEETKGSGYSVILEWVTVANIAEQGGPCSDSPYFTFGCWAWCQMMCMLHVCKDMYGFNFLSQVFDWNAYTVVTSGMRKYYFLIKGSELLSSRWDWFTLEQTLETKISIEAPGSEEGTG